MFPVVKSQILLCFSSIFLFLVFGGMEQYIIHSYSSGDGFYIITRENSSHDSTFFQPNAFVKIVILRR